MSTRGIFGFRVNGADKLMYCHSDSYPTYGGQAALDGVKALLAKMSVDELRRRVASIVMVEHDQRCTVSEFREWQRQQGPDVKVDYKQATYYHVLHDLQGDLAAMVERGQMVDNYDFVRDGLYCEWGYVCNLDTESLEVYKGYQKKRGDGRFALLAPLPDGDGFYPIALVAEIPFAKLSTVDNLAALLKRRRVARVS